MLELGCLEEKGERGRGRGREREIIKKKNKKEYLNKLGNEIEFEIFFFLRIEFEMLVVL